MCEKRRDQRLERALFVRVPVRLFEALRAEARESDRNLKGQIVNILRARYPASPDGKKKAGGA